MAGDKKTLRDWCSDACHSFLCARIDERNQHGYKLESRILDIRSVDLLLAKMMDENPLLIMSFMSQQTNCVRDATGAIKEGGEVRRQDTVLSRTTSLGLLRFYPSLALCFCWVHTGSHRASVLRLCHAAQPTGVGPAIGLAGDGNWRTGFHGDMVK